MALLSCSRESDSFAPQIVITRPANESVSPRSDLTIEGYVWDDKGVQKLVLNGGTDLLAKGPLASQRGRKIVKFSFAADSLSGGKVSYELRAVDNNRHSTTREIKVTVDTQKPSIEIDNVGSQFTTVTVSGVVKDNQKVSRIGVNGEALNISPAQVVPFYTVIPRSRRDTIEITAKDGVGNLSSKSIPVPAAPPPPPPPVLQNATNTTTTTPQTTTRRRRRRARTTTTTTVTTPAPATTTVIGAPPR